MSSIAVGSSSDRLTEQLRSIVAESAGAPEFVELASLLAESPDTRAEAREVCFRGLAEDPKNTRGRLVLARLFYLDRMFEFCIRELLEIQRQVGAISSLERLIASFGELASQFMSSQGKQMLEAKGTPTAETMGTSEAPAEPAEKVLAEIDVDAEFLDILEELEDDDK